MSKGRVGRPSIHDPPDIDEAQREMNWRHMIYRLAQLTQENLVLVDRCEKLQDALDRSIGREAAR